MDWKDAKYLIAYLLPLAAYWSVYEGGVWSFGAIYLGFVVIPLVELFVRRSPENHPPEKETERVKAPFFDYLLYLNVPLVYGLVVYYLFTLQQGGLATYEVVGMTCSVGLILGTAGINVAHELGHRASWHERLMAKALLLPELYTHFIIEHNLGHHKHVATPEDPASAREGELVYAFWFRSVTGGYLNAWKLERERLQRQGKAVLSWHNEMVRFTLLQIAYLAAIGWVFGWALVPYAIAIAVFGFLMLESVNYIEHYGLQRQRTSSGRYERVGPQHSWNSDHELGRIFLYELTRHSDHHFKASRKYQILRHQEQSPQLPTGYPGSILLSLVPPLWFSIMRGKSRKVERL
ncbi:MAG: alkane 1-monooxygenase [Bacteroidetes bacterium]|jgi:alkane 1-monooxygenase|nr:alkane 1-monooxygenase [Bacteroidota bacterium]